MDKRNKSQEQGLMHCFLFEPSIYIALVSEVKGEITAEEIKAAVEKAYTQNETTMSKVVLENGNGYFENIPQTGCKVFIDERDWHDIMHESEKETFRINEGELFRTYIIPDSSKQKYTIFMMAHHIAADGKGLLLLLEDILTILSGGETEYRYLNKEGVVLPPAGLKYPFVIEAFLNYLNRKWKKQGRCFDWDDYYHIHQEFWKSRESDVEVETLEKEKLEEIRRQCKEMGITVNSYMITEALKNHPDYTSFSVMVSHRGENRSISNHVAILKLEYQYSPKKSFSENAQQVHRLIQAQMEDANKRYFVSATIHRIDPVLMDASLMYTYTEFKNKVAEITANMIGYHGNSKTNLALTNLTNIDIQRDYERFHLENVFGIAACMSAAEKVICVGSYQGRMTITYCDAPKKS